MADAIRFSPDEAKKIVFSWVRQIVAATPGSTVTVQQRRAARDCRIPVERFRDLWHGEARRVDAHELWNIQIRRNELAIERARADDARQELLARLPRRLAFLAPPPLPQDLPRRKRG